MGMLLFYGFLFFLSFVTEDDDHDQPLQTAKSEFFIEFSTDLQENIMF